MAISIIKIKDFIIQFQKIANSINKSMNFKNIDLQKKCIIKNDNEQNTYIFIKEFEKLQITIDLYIKKKFDGKLKEKYSEINKFNNSNKSDITKMLYDENKKNEKDIILDMKNKFKLCDMKKCVSNYIDRVKRLVEKEENLNKNIKSTLFFSDCFIEEKLNDYAKNDDIWKLKNFENLHNDIKSEIKALTTYFIASMKIYYDSFYEY